MQVHIELLDANQEHVIEEWTFSPQTHAVVRMGRARENDVVISDRYVSRLHAELRFHDGFWEIVTPGAARHPPPGRKSRGHLPAQRTRRTGAGRIGHHAPLFAA
jgi:pSer/pThr/pTyr-binding forkhead associated (FHA) protein